MTLRKFTATSLLIFAMLLIFASCSVKQEITISTDGSGSGEFRIELSDSVIDLIDQNKSMMGAEDLKILDVEKIDEGFNEIPAITLTNAESPDEKNLVGEFTYTDIESIFSFKKELQEAGAISFVQQDEVSTLEVNLDVDNFQQVAKILKLDENPFYQFFGPQENVGMSDEDFLEMMSLMLGDEGIKNLQESIVELKVNVEGDIIESNGEVFHNPDYVVFEIPLIRFFVMNQEISLFLKFQ